VFKVKSKKVLGTLEIGEEIPDSDFALHCPQTNEFVQFEYVDGEKVYGQTEVRPGIFAISKRATGLVLEKTSFVSDNILEEFVHTHDIQDKIDCFFKNIHVYAEEGFEVAKRGILLWGPAGTGKSTAISKVCRGYVNDNKTAVIVWHTDKFEPQVIKGFIKHFKYVGVEKIIFVAEDIGGTEQENARFRSDASLLSLLDNQEKTFTIPTLILATTNFPEAFLANLTNRPNRFDDKIQVGYPDKESRGKLLSFFTKGAATPEDISLIQDNKCKEFTPAHIREIRIRSRIYSKTIKQVITEMLKEIAEYKAMFQDKKAMGFND